MRLQPCDGFDPVHRKYHAPNSEGWLDAETGRYSPSSRSSSARLASPAPARARLSSSSFASASSSEMSAGQPQAAATAASRSRCKAELTEILSRSRGKPSKAVLDRCRETLRPVGPPGLRRPAPPLLSERRNSNGRRARRLTNPGWRSVGYISPSSFRGASAASEPGIDNHHREYGLRIAATRRPE